jgi:RNA polymerase sigma-70 factor (ECF subfamily)
MRNLPRLSESGLRSASDAEVVLHALKQRDAAARELVRRYERPVFNLVSRIVHDRAVAEDLAQETFLKVFRRLGTYDPRRRFSAWILKIAHNSALDHLRRTKVPSLSIDEEAADGTPYAEHVPDPRALAPDLSAERARFGEALEDALARLRPEYRTALVLRYQEELDYREVADIIGVPIGTVKTFLHRGRQALARELAAAGWGPPEPVKPAPGDGRREG